MDNNNCRHLPRVLAVIFALAVISTFNAMAADSFRQNGNGILIAYFGRVGNTNFPPGLDTVTSASVISHEGRYFGNTELVARWIQAQVGGDLFLIQTSEPYSPDYRATVERGERENREQIRPPLSSHVKEIEKYDIIFLGYPAWAYDIPMPLYSFLEEYDLAGKTIIPFCTSGGSGVSQTARTIERLQPRATMREGITVSHSRILNSRDAVIEWLRKLGY
jgi:flavodoxin